MKLWFFLFSQPQKMTSTGFTFLFNGHIFWPTQIKCGPHYFVLLVSFWKKNLQVLLYFFQNYQEIRECRKRNVLFFVFCLRVVTLEQEGATNGPRATSDPQRGNSKLVNCLFDWNLARKRQIKAQCALRTKIVMHPWFRHLRVA